MLAGFTLEPVSHELPPEGTFWKMDGLRCLLLCSGVTSSGLSKLADAGSGIQSPSSVNVCMDVYIDGPMDGCSPTGTQAHELPLAPDPSGVGSEIEPRDVSDLRSAAFRGFASVCRE